MHFLVFLGTLVARNRREYSDGSTVRREKGLHASFVFGKAIDLSLFFDRIGTFLVMKEKRSEMKVRGKGEVITLQIVYRFVMKLMSSKQEWINLLFESI